jgi:hypothetical protein
MPRRVDSASAKPSFSRVIAASTCGLTQPRAGLGRREKPIGNHARRASLPCTVTGAETRGIRNRVHHRQSCGFCSCQQRPDPNPKIKTLSLVSPRQLGLAVRIPAALDNRDRRLVACFMHVLPFCEAPIVGGSFRAAGASAVGCLLWCRVEYDLVGEYHFTSSPEPRLASAARSPSSLGCRRCPRPSQRAPYRLPRSTSSICVPKASAAICAWSFGLAPATRKAPRAKKTVTRHSTIYSW